MNKNERNKNIISQVTYHFCFFTVVKCNYYFPNLLGQNKYHVCVNFSFT